MHRVQDRDEIRALLSGAVKLAIRVDGRRAPVRRDLVVEIAGRPAPVPEREYNIALDALDFYGRSRRIRANDLSETVKLVILLGQYMQDNYQGRYYAKAQNLARTLRAAYDEALKGVDLLLMPTLPLKATLLPPPDASREVYVARALEMLNNTCPFDVTGHPAVTTAGMSAGLPVGMMLIGRHWEDGTVLRAADAFQKIG